MSPFLGMKTHTLPAADASICPWQIPRHSVLFLCLCHILCPVDPVGFFQKVLSQYHLLKRSCFPTIL